MRTQENWVISVDPKIIKNASPNYFIEWACKPTYGPLSRFGMGAAGKVNESHGNIKPFKKPLIK